MFDLFGAEMPLAVRFFLAFLIVLGLIGAAAWAVRRFGSGRLGGAGLRGRQPRLSVIERTSVDARRWLYLVRRDNVEHLLMIGGPTDVVVEPNIVRATPAAREPTVARAPAAPETLPRAIPLPESVSNGSWPLQPEPTGLPPLPPRRAPRPEPIPEEPEAASAPKPPETPAHPQREALAALADDLATNPVPPRSRPAPVRPQPAEQPRAERRAEPRPEARPEPRLPTQPAAEPASAADQSLAEMAQRLEAALRKPKTAEAREPQASPVPATGPVAPTVEPEAEAAASATAPPPPSVPLPPSPTPPLRPTRPAAAAETKPPHADAKPKEGKALYDTLEQEMASLLGRPAGKT